MIHKIDQTSYSISDFIWPFLPPYMGVIPNSKITFIFPISCILVHIFPIFMIYFPKCEEKGSFPIPQIKSLSIILGCFYGENLFFMNYGGRLVTKSNMAAPDEFIIVVNTNEKAAVWQHGNISDL